MNFEAFDDLPPYRLTPARQLFRIQPVRSRAGNRAIGPLRVPPPGVLNGRFCLPDRRVAYFADSPETAGYEAFGRREQVLLSLDRLRRGELLCAVLAGELQLLDMTPHAADFPGLQATRFGPTQALAANAAAAGYDGIAYLSAQRHGGVCYALFEHVLPAIRARWRQRLIDPESGNLHCVVAAVARGSGLPLA